MAKNRVREFDRETFDEMTRNLRRQQIAAKQVSIRPGNKKRESKPHPQFVRQDHRRRK